MSENVQGTATDTLVPRVVTVTVGEDSYRIAPFCLAKTMIFFRLLTELAEAAGVQQAAGELSQAATEGELEGIVAPGFIARILGILPRALREGTPALYKVLGLIVTSNATLRELEENDGDIEGHILKLGRKLAYEGDANTAVQLIVSAIPQIGIETIMGNLPTLMALLGLGGKTK